MDDLKQVNSLRAPFVVVEGPDGCGKSTIVKQLKEMVSEMSLVRQDGTLHACDVYTTRQPEGVYREILLKSFAPDSTESPVDQAMLAILSRRKSYFGDILPRLGNKQVVISDRWDISTFATQGIYGDHALDVAKLEAVSGKLVPDYYIHVRATFETCMERTRGRSDNNEFEVHHTDEAKLRKLHEAYDTLSTGYYRFAVDWMPTHMFGNENTRHLLVRNDPLVEGRPLDRDLKTIARLIYNKWRNAI